jgi:hypothetical protein
MPSMRLLLILGVVPVVAILALVATNVLQPAPARDRLAGVVVTVDAVRVDDTTAGRHRLTIGIDVSSSRDLDDCLAFALDEPFAGRRLSAQGETCLRPRAGRLAASLVLEAATDDDVAFPSHTLVWGVAGGRCGPVLEALGVCVVDQAGTVAVDLPSRSPLPPFGPFPSYGTLFSFGPLFSFDPLP